jgi:hypothetical protein
MSMYCSTLQLIISWSCSLTYKLCHGLQPPDQHHSIMITIIFYSTGSSHWEGIDKIGRRFFGGGNAVSQTPEYSNCNIQVIVRNIGAWVVKFCKNGVIVNHRLLVYAYVSLGNDWLISLLTNTLGITLFSISFKFMRRSLSCPTMHSGRWSMVQYCYQMPWSNMTWALKAPPPQWLTSFKVYTFSKVCDYRNGSSTANSGSATEILSPIKFSRRPHPFTSETTQPLKHGWLLKKRDIFHGWFARYFAIYPGRVNYYLDQNDQHPRNSVSLVCMYLISQWLCYQMAYGAIPWSCRSELTCFNVNGASDHWCIL